MPSSRATGLFLLAQLSGLACAGGQSARAPDAIQAAADPSIIKQLEERLRRAMVAADTATLGALWAPEYLSTSAVGHTSNRPEALMAYGSGLVKVDTAVVRDLEVRTYGPMAVSLGLLDWAGSAAARTFRGTVRFQHVWVLHDRAWRLVASQLTSQPATP